MENKSSTGSTIAAIIIIGVIVLGGLYFWGKRIEEQRMVQSLVPAEIKTETAAVVPVTQNEASVIKAVISDDSTASIEAILKDTKVSGLDKELGGSN